MRFSLVLHGIAVVLHALSTDSDIPADVRSKLQVAHDAIGVVLSASGSQPAGH